MFLRASCSLVFACTFLMGWTAAPGEEPQVHITPRPSPRPRTTGGIRVDVSLVMVPVTVTDSLGTPYAGLKRESFRLLEDGVEQDIKYFSSQPAPVSLGVVFDASQSMSGKLDQSRDAVSQLFGAKLPGDEFFVVEFNDSPRILCNFTSDTVRIERSLVGIEPRNWTALFDAVYVSVRQTRQAKNQRKALLILSDGGDNNSRYTEREMKSLVRESDVCIYSIALASGGLLRRHARLLRNLSEETGGQSIEVERTADLPRAVSKISAAMRLQYVLGYFSNNPKNNGFYRKVEVKLNPQDGQPALHPTWRRGYYAPDER